MNRLKKIINYYNWGGRYLTNKNIVNGDILNKIELEKLPYRYEILNFLLEKLNRSTNYLEIGVRNPDDNFNRVNARQKYSIDPGVEFIANPVDFKVTSDVFFEGLKNGVYLQPDILFDVIFIDGLHLADQVQRDIDNALRFIKEDGFIVLHDCNPPTEWHARDDYQFDLSPAKGYWNGTTWKAFLKSRFNDQISSCCIDSDWGIGIISKTKKLGNIPTVKNDFFEFHVLNKNRKELLNLISFEEFKRKFN
jgi:hypothetical protein